MLAQFVLIVFAMCAVLSLVIDVAYARMTQVQMQIAADTAALEGVRGVLDPATGQIVDDPTLQRMAANRLVRSVFDDDLDPTNGDPDYQFGAGPIIELTDGVTNLHALQTMSVPDSRVYKPDLQLNQENLPYGDMVSGCFRYDPDPTPSEDLAYALPGTMVCDEPQNGSGPYARNDFNPNPPGSGPPADVDHRAFLVRLRRSNEFRDLPGQTEPDVASSGPSLPLMFGKGTTIFGDDPSSAYSVRRDGLTVRATAIAATRPALHVGLPQSQSNPPLPGVTPVTLVDTCVQRAGAAAPLTINVTVNPANGVITRSAPGTAACPVGAVVGRFVGNPITIGTVGRCVSGCLPGEASPPPVAVACPSVTSVTGYGPVYSAIGPTGPARTNRIIGFTRINLNRPNPCPPAAPGPPPAFAAVVTATASAVPASNATASLIGGLPLPADARPADVAELLDKNLVRNGRVNYGPVRVPMLAR